MKSFLNKLCWFWLYLFNFRSIHFLSDLDFHMLCKHCIKNVFAVISNRSSSKSNNLRQLNGTSWFLVGASWIVTFFQSTRADRNSSTKFYEIPWCQMLTMEQKMLKIRKPLFSAPGGRQFGPTSGFFGYCKRILDTLKSFCYFLALDMAPTYAVPGFFWNYYNANHISSLFTSESGENFSLEASFMDSFLITFFATIFRSIICVDTYLHMFKLSSNCVLDWDVASEIIMQFFLKFDRSTLEFCKSFKLRLLVWPVTEAHLAEKTKSNASSQTFVTLSKSPWNHSFFEADHCFTKTV